MATTVHKLSQSRNLPNFQENGRRIKQFFADLLNPFQLPGSRLPVGAMALAADPATMNPRIRCRFSFFSPRKPLPLVTTAIKKFPSSPPPPFLVLSGHRALRLSPLKAASSSFNGFAHPQNLGTKTGNFDAESGGAGFRERLVSGLVLLRSFLPGGSWWKLELEEGEEGSGEEGKRERKKDVSVIVALRRMWILVADDRWVIFLAFTSLMIAAVWIDILISSLIDILLEMELKWVRLSTA